MSGQSIQIEQLQVWREDGAERQRVIDGLSLEIAPGERVAIAGPNGAGKTSLLLAMVGALPFTGAIAVGGRTLEPKSLEAVRREVGYVFADPADQLFLPTVREEVGFGPRQRGVSGAALSARIDAALAAVGLGGFEDRSPLALSLGEQRRLAAATVLSIEPGALLFDEPTASLDPRARRAMLDTLRGLDATLLLATHDLDAVLDLDARVVLLDRGHMVAEGPAAELLRDEALLERAGMALPLGLQR